MRCVIAVHSVGSRFGVVFWVCGSYVVPVSQTYLIVWLIKLDV